MAWAPPATRRPPVPSCSRSRPQRIHRPRGAERRHRLCEETTAFFPAVSSTRISEGGGVLRVHVCTAGGASHPFLASPARSSYRCAHTPNPVGCGEEVERAGRAGAFSSPVPRCAEDAELPMEPFRGAILPPGASASGTSSVLSAVAGTPVTPSSALLSTTVRQ
jgi:hypothetical protein